MTRAWFEYNGVNSTDMHLYIENDVAFPSPEADVEFVEVLGRDGDVAVNNERLRSVNFSLPIRLKLPSNKDINKVATDISNWLKSEIGWSPLRFSGSPDYEYIAMMYEQYDIQETLKQYGRTVLTFRLKPYKRRIGQKTLILENGTTLSNTESREAKPLIHVEGTGDINFKNNDEDWLKLRSVDGHITIDSDLMSVYKDDSPQYDKMIDMKPMFPLLYKGNNKITWSGNVHKVTILPRWEAIT
jgi:predicted phage tail component-like protein